MKSLYAQMVRDMGIDRTRPTRRGIDARLAVSISAVLRRSRAEKEARAARMTMPPMTLRRIGVIAGLLLGLLMLAGAASAI